MVVKVKMERQTQIASAKISFPLWNPEAFLLLKLEVKVKSVTPKQILIFMNSGNRPEISTLSL
jgi:hypothetical protein